MMECCVGLDVHSKASVFVIQDGRGQVMAQGEFTQEATDHGYGIDCGLRDPFGNQIRILQPKAWG
jgi:hypothetical protein